jgi:ubiquitin C-terminal hydrolase
MDKIAVVIENTAYSDTPFDRQRKKMDIDWCNKVCKEYSDIIPMLYGQQISQIICNNCGKIWHNYEVYQQISVALPDGIPSTSSQHHPHTSLMECLQKHFDELPLNEWKCDRCNMGQGSTQTSLLWRNPKILIISLKRFEFDPRTGHFIKNNKNVDIPETLNVSSKTIGKTKRIYHLKAIAFHSGSYYGGHYHAVCKQRDGSWYLYDDDVVHRLDSHPSNIGNGYVYFYEAL